MKVTNMTSPNGNPVANQFIIYGVTIPINKQDLTGVAFQSYRSIIAFRTGASLIGGITTYLDRTYWNYSRTTSKYRSMFLGETTAETQRKIDSGEYILTDLN